MGECDLSGDLQKRYFAKKMRDYVILYGKM